MAQTIKQSITLLEYVSWTQIDTVNELPDLLFKSIPCWPIDNFYTHKWFFFINLQRIDDNTNF